MSTETTPMSTNNPPRSPLGSASPPQQWAPPKSPLPPHRLAKLANALGVSMPMPATQPTFPYSSSPYLSHSNSLPTPSSATEFLRRSPTPSVASAAGTYQAPTSKFLLHVIPPLHLQHDFDMSEDTPPPPGASGYHTQFRRGTLVPVYPTLHLQLSAIAKEYALPGTMGLILYLVNTNVAHSPSIPAGLTDPGDELGPRLSEDIWRHLWIRVLKAEQREEITSRAASPNPLGLVLSAKTSPNPNGFDSTPPFLRTAPSINSTDPTSSPYPLTPSSSSVTTASTSDMQHKSKSSLSSVAQSEPQTPDSSVLDSRRADSLDLPGLSSNSIIPILAKVEFDIDRRKAAWYDPWVRSRKMNQVKRAESRASRKETTDDSSDERKPPLDLKLSGRLLTASPISLKSLAAKDKEGSEAGYQQLSDSTSEESDYGNPGEQDEEDEEDEEEDATARVKSIPNGRDPLSDVFGTDEDTWAELRNSQLAKQPRISNPNVVDLALTAADLADLPELPPSDDEDELAGLTKSEDEVEDLLSQMGRPALSVTIPSSPPQGKKHVPPPLILKQPVTDLAIPIESPQPTSGSSRLAYLHSTSEENIAPPPAEAQLEPPEHEQDDEFVDEITRVKSPAESEKREGAIFDDLDLGLDLTEEFDENDPNDHRRSQLIMKAQLDEIEKNLAQFSPKALRTDLSDGIAIPLSPNLSGVLRNSDVLPPTPGITRLSDSFSNGSSTPPAESSVARQWPAVPFSAFKDAADVPQTATFPPSPPPPRLAVNGVTTSAPKAFVPPTSSTEVSSETQVRRREMEEEQELTYPAIQASMPTSSDSPIIPLSPDPFGRYPSSPEPSSSRQPSSYWNSDNINHPAPYDADYHNMTSPIEGARPPSSRFSADSTSNEEAISKSLKGNSNSSGGLMSVKSLRKLWRKSNKSSISSTPGTTSGRTSPATSLNQSARPSEDSSSMPAMPTTPTFGAFPPPPPMMQPPMARNDGPLPNAAGLSAPPTVRGSLAPPVPPPIQDRRDRDTGFAQLQFDQESPYPIHRSPVPRYSPRPPSPAYPQQPSQLPAQPTQPLPPNVPIAEKPSVRKSILKAFKSSQSNGANPEPRSSIDRSGRSRRGSVTNTGGLTPNIIASDIPPSPRIPDHLLAGSRPGTGQALDTRQSRPRSNTSSMARSSSPPRSMASSRDSQETRPSFDVSQFEMVSPKMNSTLSYPYHGLDHA